MTYVFRDENLEEMLLKNSMLKSHKFIKSFHKLQLISQMFSNPKITGISVRFLFASFVQISANVKTGGKSSLSS